MNIKNFLTSLSAILLLSSAAFAKTVRYELNVARQDFSVTGKTVDFALTVNGGIPAPTLEFTEGDDAEILVNNKLIDEEVSIHWHGILLPPEEDGVAYVNTPPIHPGKSHLFKFKIRQNGTYWYHSHTAVQEQKGVYGAFIIHPKKKAFAYDKDAVLVLSDWSDENADQIIKNLRKDGDFYLYKKDSVRSYFGAIQAKGFKNHLSNEWSRMGGMDLSDIGYDAFLINGKRDSQLLAAHPGEKIRLRIINAAASSYFYVAMGVPMTVVAADGVDIEPVQAKEILMGMAETYDILFTVPEDKNYEIRATVQDVTGYGSTWIGMGEKVPAPNKPLPDMYATMGQGGQAMPGMDHSKMPGMDQGKMDHSKMDQGEMKDMDHDGKDPKTGHARHSEASAAVDHSSHSKSEAVTGKEKPAAGGGQDHSAHARPSMGSIDHSADGSKPQPAKMKKSVSDAKISNAIPNTKSTGAIDWTTQSDAMLRQNQASRNLNIKSSSPVETLTVDSIAAIEPTSLPKNAKVHDIKFVLSGDMERYVWHLNGKTIQQDRLVYINKGEVVRFIFQNDTMMHHPMHLHGHFFRVVNEKGEKSPLKHTVDVPPHMSRTIEFFANEPGQWMLHCHNLYHMKTGMARVIRYNDFKMSPEMAKHDAQDPHNHEHIYNYSGLEASSNHARVQTRFMRSWDELSLEIESADVEGKNFSFEKPWETEGNLLYRRWFTNFFNVQGGLDYYDERTYGIVGVGYILPMLFESSAYVNHEGKVRLDLEKRFQWTKNVFSDAEVTWRPDWGGERDFEYEVSLMYGPSWYWSAGLMLTEKSLGVGAQVQF